MEFPLRQDEKLVAAGILLVLYLKRPSCRRQLCERDYKWPKGQKVERNPYDDWINCGKIKE